MYGKGSMGRKKWELEILEVRWSGSVVRIGPGEGSQQSHGDQVSGFRGALVETGGSRWV